MTAPPSRLRVALTLIALVPAIAISGPLVVGAERASGSVPGMAPAVIAFWRTLIGGGLILAIAAVRERPALKSLTRADLASMSAAGAILAAHYLLWMGSLSRTTVLSSDVLVTTNPIWVAAGSALLLGEPSTRSTWIAIGAGITGATILAAADAGTAGLHGGSSPLLGDAMALAGAWASSGALLYGRALRARLPFATFTAVMSLACAAVLFVAALVSGASFVPGTTTQALCVLAIALGPHLIGNSILGWALGWMPAPKVALVILGEPVGASLIAFVVFDQRPGLLAIAGGLLVLAAVWEGARGGSKLAPRAIIAD